MSEILVNAIQVSYSEIRAKLTIPDGKTDEKNIYGSLTHETRCSNHD